MDCCPRCLCTVATERNYRGASRAACDEDAGRWPGQRSGLAFSFGAGSSSRNQTMHGVSAKLYLFSVANSDETSCHAYELLFDLFVERTAGRRSRLAV